MKKTIFIYLSILSCIFLSSCATIIGGSRYYAQVIVKDNPKAKIYNNGVYIGTGKGFAMIERKRADQVNFAIEEEGYQKEYRSFNLKKLRGWNLAGSISPGAYILFIPIAGVAVLIDAVTGAWWKPDINERGVIKTDFRHYNYVLEYQRVPIEKTKKVTTKKVERGSIKSDLRSTEEKLRDLKKLLDEEIITKEEFVMMKKKFIGLEDPKSEIKNDNQSKINDLDNMLVEGILTQEEYNQMRKKIDSSYKFQESKEEQSTSEVVQEPENKQSQKPAEEKVIVEEKNTEQPKEKKESQKLKDLNKMLEFGIITEEEYNEMKEKLATQDE